MTEIKLRAGGFFYPVHALTCGDTLRLQFGYNKLLLEEIRSMAGAKWHPANCDCPYCAKLGGKAWSILDNQRNRFQLRFLAAKKPEDNPYHRYDLSLIAVDQRAWYNHEHQKELMPYEHQFETASHIITRRQCIVAEEMGLGKTLADLMATKEIDPEGWWYVAPKSVIRAIERELMIWGWPVHKRPMMMTYESLVKTMENWKPGVKAPQKVTFDECARLKTPTSQRSQAAKALADGVRQDWGDNAYVVLMSGTPAPKSPADWWHQCEVACPGFLKEGDIFKFRNRLGVIVQKESITGGVYPQLVTWRDDEKKCQTCGLLATDPVHGSDDENAMFGSGENDNHKFEPGKNEILGLYKRLQGLVIVKWKKDCLELPDKRYRVIEVKPKPSTLRVAAVIAKSSKTVISGLTLLRELSDGFQYQQVPIGKETCPRCHGEKKAEEKFEIEGTCPNCPRERDDFGNCVNHTPTYREEVITCPHCGGTGEVDKFDRIVKEVPCPKDDALIELLDEYSDVGRLVIYGGFTGAIDRVIKICHQEDWATIRVDQGKWTTTTSKGESILMDPLELFQNKTLDHLEKYPRVAFVAHPKSGGEGQTLTASPAIVYFSNDYDGNARTQSEDRIHRIGMDLNKGALIIDIFHLPSDKKVLDNLKAKRNLELMSLGELSEAMVVTESEGRET